jgi:hypothetical protein
MTIPIDSLNIIGQLKRGDIIFRVDNDEIEKFKIVEINEWQIVAVGEVKYLHLKMFPVCSLIEEHWCMEKRNLLVTV